MIRRPPRSTHCISSAASDVYKRQVYMACSWCGCCVGLFFFADGALDAFDHIELLLLLSLVKEPVNHRVDHHTQNVQSPYTQQYEQHNSSKGNSGLCLIEEGFVDGQVGVFEGVVLVEDADK
eukprot:TRINITY_DN5946_c0_g1_i11.p2 TRINITY_DN5946_c0_g1~~TRINITY_DN5946_c0_g1_i11.p2  ORF type:complete len:129 (+),score=18.81 TRINITY_DN5946_c0_g1_i11:23-388(+)